MSDTTSDGKIICRIDNAAVHAIPVYLKDKYPEWTIDRYKEEFPDAPLYSAHAQKILAEKRAALKEASKSGPSEKRPGVEKKAFHSVFDLGSSKAAMNKRGEPIMISVFETSPELAIWIPTVDRDYVFDIETTKDLIIGFELNKPMLAWGFHGTGKTTLFEQIAARTGRPFMRIQHTINVEESHIIGQYKVKDGATVWENGPLVDAMLNGMVYCADEYDFASPTVTSVYQPVLEGKPLIIKEAPAEFRVVKPHPNFRFVATGNTNGGGDETGLYQGTQIQNSANYSRFGITIEVGYMAEKIEKAIIAAKAGISPADATKFIDFAKSVREAFANGKIGATISPRELISSAEIGRVKGSEWRNGLGLGFTNRLSRIDKEVVGEFAQRVFG